MNHRHNNSNTFDQLLQFNYQNRDYTIEVDMKNEKQDSKGQGQIYEKNISKTAKGVTRNIVTREFLKKYLSFVKSQKQPELDKDCIEYASLVYAVI